MKLRRHASRLTVLFGFAVVAACVSDEPVNNVFANDGGGGDSDGGGGGITGDGSSPANPDGSTSGKDGAPAGPVCTSADNTCSDQNTLKQCNADMTAIDTIPCDLGCLKAPSPHCGILTPTTPVDHSIDLDPTSLSDIVLQTNTSASSDVGSFGSVRNANMDVTKHEAQAGIAFRSVLIPGTSLKLGIFTFKSLNVPDGKRLTIGGVNAVALVAVNDIKIAGTIDLVGGCYQGGAGPGGGVGAFGATPAAGQGKGGNGGPGSADTTSGAGAAFGDYGAPGAGAGGLQPPQGGTPYGNAALIPLSGGSGGGIGGAVNGNATGGSGGGGGGALQLVAGGNVIIANGTALGGINASGCGGGNASAAATSGAGGGGGGSGGAVLIEALTVTIGANGAVAANGGGGGGGSYNNAIFGASGFPGALAQVGGNGGTSSGSCGSGGKGGAVNDVPSSSKTKGAAGTSTTTGCAGGGGGAAGRLRFNTKSGMIIIQGNGFTSPRLTIDVDGMGNALATTGTLVGK